jgi:outer membrane murein-binding lipoprotein Lpp
MAETGRPGDEMTDRELLAEVWEISCATEARIGELTGEVRELRAKITDLETEFGPLARRYRRIASPLSRAGQNGRQHAADQGP